MYSILCESSYLLRFEFSCSWDSRIVEKAIDEEGGEHAMGGDCQALWQNNQKKKGNSQQAILRCFYFELAAQQAFCTFHVHIAAITTIITHDLLPSGLELSRANDHQIRRLWVQSRRCRRFFLGLVRSPISLPAL